MSRRELLLHLLRQAGERGVTTSELLQACVGSRYGARLLELREEGHTISAERVRDGAWRYTLLDEPPAAVAETPPAPDGVPRLFDAPRAKPRNALFDWDDAA